MWSIIRNNYKTVLTAIEIFLVAIIVAFLFEDYYRRLVRFLFKFFNGDNIQFIGKNLFASNCFVVSFAFFCLLTFLMLKSSQQSKRLKRSCLTVLIFFISTFLITALDSKMLIVECAACDNGVRKLVYNEVAYDRYFIISLIISFGYLLASYLLERPKRKNAKAHNI